MFDRLTTFPCCQKPISLLGALVLAAPGVSASPDWFARTWQSDAGLPDNTVVGINQTPDGFLWVATKTGLVRFDGVQFRQFPLMTGVTPPGVIHSLLADRLGRLWVMIEQQTLLCLELGRPTTVFNLAEGQSGQGTGMMAEDADGSVWVSYNSGEVFRIRDGRARLYTAEDGLPEGGDCQLAVDPGGRLWFARGSWVGMFRDGRFLPMVQSGVMRITATRSGGIWGYSREQLWKFIGDDPPVKLGIPPPELATASPTALQEDRAGRLLIGTSEAGLFCYDGSGFTRETTAHQTILSIKTDREGNVWLGTRGGGLNQLIPKAVDLLATGSGAPLEAVRSVCQATDGQLWAVVWQKGEVMRSAGLTWKPLAAGDGWSIGNAQCVAADPEGGVWIGTQYSGLHHWQNGVLARSLTEANGLTSNRVNALLMTPSGELWIGTGFSEVQQHFLQRRKNGQLRTFKLPPGSGPVAVMAEDAAGDCWAATAKGLLLRIHQDVLTDETGGPSGAGGAIRCLLGTPDGSLWIGYGGQGLGRLNTGRFTRCRKDQGLHDDYISNILADGHGRLWCAGNRGIFSVLEKDLADLAEGRAARVRSVAYGRSDGLPGLQASYDSWPGALHGTDGRLFFAMQSGVAAVNTNRFRENPPPPQVVVETVTANGRLAAAYGVDRTVTVPLSSAPIELRGNGAHLRLPPGQRQAEFAFTAPTLAKPDNIGFRYRLRGLDADWIEAGPQRTATYSQIPPGRYRFEVNACNSDGVWNPTPAALDLTFAPYWWETAWFRMTAPLSATALLVAGIVVVLRRRHRRQIDRLELLQATERERTRIARDLHDDLGGGLTEIAMLSEVARQERAGSRELNGHLERIFQSSREMAQALDEIVWAVNPANDTLENLISFTSEFARAILVPAGIRYRLDVPAELPKLDLNSQIRHHLCMAMKECLHNVVKHARAQEVRIGIALNDRVLQMTVVDDGEGFDLAALRDQAGRHNGLDNLRQRMAAIGGICEIRSASGDGTRVRLEATI